MQTTFGLINTMGFTVKQNLHKKCIKFVKSTFKKKSAKSVILLDNALFASNAKTNIFGNFLNGAAQKEPAAECDENFSKNVDFSL